MLKRKNSKGFYKVGNVTFRDTRHGTSVLVTQIRIYDPEFIAYICNLDRASDGEISAPSICGAVATLGFKNGLRVDNAGKNKKKKE